MHSSDFVHDFGIVITGAAVSLVIFRRLNLSPVLGFLLAGALLGPFSLIGSQVSDVETIRLLADVGLVMLLFALGVELGWQRIRSVGFGVIIIGMLELSVMMGLGYMTGSLLGWTAVESLFLGAAIAVSSSAVLVQMLRDRGELTSKRGQVIVGILVVEDFAAVILLSILAGVATQGGEGDGGAIAISWRLVVFAVTALVFGALLVPRILDLIARLQSNQVMLMGALGMCFGFAMAAGELGLSAGAGAFIIGTVVGDTRHSHTISRMTEPVRDLFAALFFVSIGMLVNVADLGRFIVPVLLITFVVVVGKVLVNTLGAYITGRDGRTSLEVGTAMAQPGEFSLAMVKTGTDNGAVSTALTPIVTAVIIVSSVLYPLVSGSAAVLERMIERRAPHRVRRHALAINTSAILAGQIMRADGDAGKRIKRLLSIAIVNTGVIGLVVVAGMVVLNFVGPIAEAISVSPGLVGVVLGGILVTLSVPPGMTVWKSLSEVSEEITHELLLRRINIDRESFPAAVTSLIGHSFFAVALFVIAVWMTPLLWELVSVGELATPASVLIMIGTMALTAKVALTIHSSLEETFEHTFLGPEDEEEDLPALALKSKVAPLVPEPKLQEEPVKIRPPVVQNGSAFSGTEWQRSFRRNHDNLRR